MSGTSQKWYDNKNKLFLSILFWPALVYGLYKTSIISKSYKILLLGGISLIFIFFLSNTGIKKTSGCNCEVEDEYGRGKKRFNAISYKDCKDLYKGEWLGYNTDCEDNN